MSDADSEMSFDSIQNGMVIARSENILYIVVSFSNAWTTATAWTTSSKQNYKWMERGWAVSILQERNNRQEGYKMKVQILNGVKTCGRTRDLRRGKEFHEEVVKGGQEHNNDIANALINMYGKCGSMGNAREVFNSVKHLTGVSWHKLILGYVENGQGQAALDIFIKLRSDGHPTNSVTFLAALKACSFLTKGASRWAECRDKGKKLHNISVESGYNRDIYVQSTLIVMYSKCGCMVDARKVFDGMKHVDVVSWNVLILGYAENNEGQSALEMLIKMKTKSFTPDSVTLVGALKACSSLALKQSSSQWTECSKEIHNIAVENGRDSDVYVQSTLVDTYAKCSSMISAREVFDNMKHPTVVSWNVLILGYAGNGQGRSALDMLTRMRIEGPAFDSVTLVAVLKACTSLAVMGGIQWVECRDRCKQIHTIAVDSGLYANAHVQGTLVDVYAKCGSMANALEVFDGMRHPDVVSWTALILGYADNGQGHTALHLFTKMKIEGHAPDSVTLLAALKACISLAAKKGPTGWKECRDRGAEIHKLIVKSGCVSDVYLRSTLVDMYAKCGSMVDAQEVFDSIKYPTVVSWNVLIVGYVDNGQGDNALQMFTRMKSKGPPPDSVTFGGVLKACGTVGALEFGKTIHLEIERGKNLDVVLVTCLVDFYAKCGSLSEAQKVFDTHAKTRDQIIWNALMAGYSSCGDHETVFNFFERMQDTNFRPDDVTFLCVLTCCSHAGLVVKGKECFDSMSKKYCVFPTLKHYTCMIDLYGRANKLDDAMVLLEHMPYVPDEVTWTTVLGACHKWKNVEIGRLAFQSLININDKDAAPYVLMGQIYESRGMVREQEMVMGHGKMLKTFTKSGETCWTNEVGDVHTFLARDNRHPQIQEIRDKWVSMHGLMRRHGYSACTEKNEELCGHSEKLALVCALINTRPGKTISIVKSLEVCDDCHNAIATISRVECRTVICRDANKIHVFKDGKCSCDLISSATTTLYGL